MKLAEMMTEEFSSVRDELQCEVSKQCHALMSRWNQVESQVTQMSTDTMHLRVSLESRMEGLRALTEDDLRKDLD